MKHFYKSLFLFFVGFTAYLAIEVCFKSAMSHGGLGCSHPLCGIMGGLSFLIFDQFNNELSWHLDLLLQGMLGACVVTLLELTVGLWDKYFLHIGMWDYSGMPAIFADMDWRGCDCDSRGRRHQLLHTG